MGCPAFIRDLYESFVQQCKSNYSPEINVTIDEKLEGFRRRCEAIQYITHIKAAELWY